MHGWMGKQWMNNFIGSEGMVSTSCYLDTRNCRYDVKEQKYRNKQGSKGGSRSLQRSNHSTPVHCGYNRWTGMLGRPDYRTAGTAGTAGTGPFKLAV